ncbi:MAG: hypothetical protein GQF41_2904 [Candidatus Rifleibacterium amylolyticum]|nr:MAG: hypothetical protein GQF41_2904 [Candidatus Rifleibacterium amylolyticum]
MSRKAETVKKKTDPQITPISQIFAYFAFWTSPSQSWYTSKLLCG